MPGKRKTSSSGLELPYPPPTAEQRLFHELNNSLSAVQLRLDLLSADPTCMWAQRSNIEAIAQSLAQARKVAERLEHDAWEAAPREG